MTRPPVDPQPVTPVTLAFGVKVNVLVVAAPVIVAVAFDVQVFAPMAVVPTVIVVLAISVACLPLSCV
jgi:hypothetical protein